MASLPGEIILWHDEHVGMIAVVVGVSVILLRASIDDLAYSLQWAYLYVLCFALAEREISSGRHFS